MQKIGFRINFFQIWNFLKTRAIKLHGSINPTLEILIVLAISNDIKTQTLNANKKEVQILYNKKESNEKNFSPPKIIALQPVSVDRQQKWITEKGFIKIFVIICYRATKTIIISSRTRH